MKRLMYLSVSILCLAIAALMVFYIGSHKVEAQAPADIQFSIEIYSDRYFIHAFLPNGDVYYNYHDGGQLLLSESRYIGNMFSGVIATEQSTWGDIKGQFKK